LHICGGRDACRLGSDKSGGSGHDMRPRGLIGNPSKFAKPLERLPLPRYRCAARRV
jgi:hypothetical protein